MFSATLVPHFTSLTYSLKVGGIANVTANAPEAWYQPGILEFVWCRRNEQVWPEALFTSELISNYGRHYCCFTGTLLRAQDTVDAEETHQQHIMTGK